MSVEIVKVQKPLNDPDPRAPAMVYAEGRLRLGYIAMRNLPPHIRRAFRTAAKLYVRAEWDAQAEAWNLGLIVGDRPW